MTLNEYQELSKRTIGTLTKEQAENHALHGMVSEIGELHAVYQKIYQGHEANEEHMMRELGDLMWFVCEYCTAKGWELEQVARANIEKLKKRYPEGFNPEASLHRSEGDD